MSGLSFVRPGSVRSLSEFGERWAEHGDDLGLSEQVRGGEGPLGRQGELFGRRLANRFATQPMEGWDAAPDGRPSELTLRRWRRFGESGVGLVWGGEAFAVEYAGRANPRQLCLADHAAGSLERLRGELLAGAREAGCAPEGPIVGLQLTHSGRWARPDGPPAPLVPAAGELDARFEDGVSVLSDGELERIGEGFVRSAAAAWSAGFDFVDVKCCHGYLLHELVGGRRRGGTYGGRGGALLFVQRVLEAIGTDCRGLGLAVRLSVGDSPAFRPGDDGIGEPTREGSEEDGLGFDMLSNEDGEWYRPGVDLIRSLHAVGVKLVNVTLGCPYTTPHLLRPAAYPPSDGYLPPEDPLRGVARHLRTVRRVKEECPEVEVVGSGYSYLQEWLAAVAEYEVEQGHVDLVGLGRMVLSYPTYARDVLEGRPAERKSLCRTFSDCTTAPRNGMVSGLLPSGSLLQAAAGGGGGAPPQGRGG